jgi:hypothetical protein
MAREGFYYRLCSGHYETSDDLLADKALEIEASA